MTDLSPATQAVLDAAVVVSWDWSNLQPASSSVVAAAVLRAAADQATPELPHSELDDPEILKGIWNERRTARAELLAIATELEGQ
jgi:hypothetical protein